MGWPTRPTHRKCVQASNLHRHSSSSNCSRLTILVLTSTYSPRAARHPLVHLHIQAVCTAIPSLAPCNLHRSTLLASPTLRRDMYNSNHNDHNPSHRDHLADRHPRLAHRIPREPCNRNSHLLYSYLRGCPRKLNPKHHPFSKGNRPQCNHLSHHGHRKDRRQMQYL